VLLVLALPTTARAGHNHLGSEKSPYLLQHADNPVWWWTWSPEALETAKREDKPIFLSIGYSTCHWCHVMERESFTNNEVANALNASFVAIKVDREERPDLDEYFMKAVFTMTGRGGWPMTTILTPEGKPFFGGTYLPRDDLLAVLSQVSEAWRTDRTRIASVVSGLSGAMAQRRDLGSAGSLTGDVLLAFRDRFEASFDATHGGAAGAPKFPPAYALRLLLRIHRRTGDDKSIAMVRKTLDAMARGGIYDHVGGGFHRYSTDNHWLVPHFEKMLYDQAALAQAYLEGFQATGEREYEKVVRETLDYVLRDMTSADGAFFSAEDADSEGVEGKFYVWAVDELSGFLKPAEALAVTEAFGLTGAGNFGGGRNILTLVNGTHVGRSEVLTSALAKMLAQRAKRVRPSRDDKVLTDWNGLMIAAMSKAGRVLSEPRYTNAAERAAHFILTHVRGRAGRVLHRYREGEARYPGSLDDYAFLIDGLIELYESDFDPAWLTAAAALQKIVDGTFLRPEGDYSFADGSDPTVPGRDAKREDNVVPAGNSVEALNLLRLRDLLLDPAYGRRASEIFRTSPPQIRDYPGAFPVLLAALDYALDRSKEVAIVGPAKSAGTLALIAATHRVFNPNYVLAVGSGSRGDAPLLKDKVARDGRPTAYVCEQQVCRAPTADPNQMASLMETFAPLGDSRKKKTGPAAPRP
jgi:uncharacterized protein